MTFNEKTFVPYKNTDWNYIVQVYNLSEEFIEKYFDRLKPIPILVYQQLSEDFLIKYQDIWDWDFVCSDQKISEEFIEKNEHLISWYWICGYQKMSKQFIIKHWKKMNMISLNRNENLSKKLKEEISSWTKNNYLDFLAKIEDRLL